MEKLIFDMKMLNAIEKVILSVFQIRIVQVLIIRGKTLQLKT